MKKIAVLFIMTSLLLFACSKDEDSEKQAESPKAFYNVEVSDFEYHGTNMLKNFSFEEVEHRQISGNETFYIFYFRDQGARKSGIRNRVVIAFGKMNNFQTSFTYTFDDSKIEVIYENGEKETLVLKKTVQRPLRDGDILYINNIPYKRKS